MLVRSGWTNALKRIFWIHWVKPQLVAFSVYFSVVLQQFICRFFPSHPLSAVLSSIFPVDRMNKIDDYFSHCSAPFSVVSWMGEWREIVLLTLQTLTENSDFMFAIYELTNAIEINSERRKSMNVMEENNKLIDSTFNVEYISNLFYYCIIQYISSASDLIFLEHFILCTSAHMNTMHIYQYNLYTQTDIIQLKHICMYEYCAFSCDFRSYLVCYLCSSFIFTFINFSYI